MRYLLDTGILLRLVHPTDPLHEITRDAVATLRSPGHTFCCGAQNMIEFWNVTTRPTSARGGFGLTPGQAAARLAVIEKAVEILPDLPAIFIKWKELVTSLGVSGVSVHDARLVALMHVHGVSNLLTLNANDFRRYPDIQVSTPREVLTI